MSALKTSTVSVRGYQKGISFTADTPGDISGKFSRYGRVDTNEESRVSTQLHSLTIDASRVIKPPQEGLKLKIRSVHEIEQVRIPIATIKCLSKLNNLSPAGTIKAFIERGSPLKLLCKIGGYGTLRVYIRDTEGS